MKKAAIALTMFAGASATDCSPGYKHKKVLTSLKCKSAAGSALLQGADNCNTNCCDLDPKTCLGLQGSSACVGDTYAPTAAQQTIAQRNTWAAIATTAANFKTDCCVAKAKCGSGSYSCPAGKKKKTGDAAWSATVCPSDDASCVTPCCATASTDECETAQIGGAAVSDASCGAGFISGKTACAGDANCEKVWGKTKFSVTATPDDGKKSSCCVVAPTCFGEKSSLTCKVGTKFDSAITAAAPKALTAYTAAAKQTACCKTDADVCAGQAAGSITCSSGEFLDAALGGRSVKGATAAQKAKTCCAPKATCSNAACPSGYKAKTSAKNTKCPGDAASCVAAAHLATCCDADLTTCGGNFPAGGAALTCAAGFYDERTFFKTQAQEDAQKAGEGIKATTQAAKDAWNLKNTSKTTATKECCTPVTNCTNITSAAKAGITTTPAAGATTTPAPVVTTTPAAAPALKFSEHKVAIQQASGGSNMVWLGVGAFMGMGVLMVVQHVRSARVASNTRDVSLE